MIFSTYTARSKMECVGTGILSQDDQGYTSYHLPNEFTWLDRQVDLLLVLSITAKLSGKRGNFGRTDHWTAGVML